MGDFVHRTTAEFLNSVDPNELPEALANYIADPDLSAVIGFDSRYWLITGDVITLMDQAARDAVDAAEAAALVTQLRAEAVATPDKSDEAVGYETRALIELTNKRDNYLVTRILELQAGLDAMKASIGNITALRDAIPGSWSATSTRPRADAVQDYKDDINAGNVDT